MCEGWCARARARLATLSDVATRGALLRLRVWRRLALVVRAWRRWHARVSKQPPTPHITSHRPPHRTARTRTPPHHHSGKAIPNPQVLSKLSRVLGVTLRKSGK